MIEGGIVRFGEEMARGKAKPILYIECPVCGAPMPMREDKKGGMYGRCLREGLTHCTLFVYSDEDVLKQFIDRWMDYHIKTVSPSPPGAEAEAKAEAEAEGEEG